MYESTIDREQIDGAFALAVDVRFNDLSGGDNQTVFHLTSVDGLDSISLAQVGSSADLEFVVVTNGVEHRVVASDALSDGEYATFRVGVDPLGTMRISKDTDLLVEEDKGADAVPRDVDRSYLIGESDQGGALTGDVLNMKLANYGDLNGLDPTSAESPCALTGETKCLCDKLFVEGDFTRGEDGPVFLPTKDLEGDGEFSSVQSLGSIPVHAMLLPDGKILSFGVGSQGNRGDAQFVYSLYDPETGIDTVLPNTTSVDLFCSNMSLDPATGNVLIMGSGDFENDAVVFDYATQTIRDADHGDMVHDRWYGQSVTMGNGEIFIIGGEKTGGGGSDIPEVWNSETGWRELTDAKVPGISGDWWYPHTYVNTRDEVIILDAGGRDIHRVTTQGSGTVEHIGTLPFAGDAQQVSIMIEADKIARIDNSGGLWVIDISDDVPTFEKIADTGANRHDGGMIALPDGKVLIVGGQTGGAWNRVENAEYGTQIWDPQTNEITDGPDLNIARLYHSTYVMLPDGTVWIGGGGVAGAINNANFEIYVPAYLFDENGDRIAQTEIEAPSNIEAGDTFQITVEDASAVARLTATKAGAWTHARNSDSRFLELDFTVVDATTIEVSTPTENVMIPGAWTIYALDANGVPSMGDIVGVNMAPLVETDNITAQSEVYGIDDDQIDGAFEIKVDVRFDDLAADVRLDGRDADTVAENAGQVVFDIGNGSEDGNRMQGSDVSGVIDYFYSDNIVLWQVGRSTDMAFSVFDGDQEYRITAEGVLVEGELATWTVAVDDAGMMRLWKDDALVAEGQGVVPNDVERKVVKVGESSWDIANDLRGKVANLEIVNAGDDPEYVHLGLPKANLSGPRYVTDRAGDVQKIVFDLTLDNPAFAVVTADIAIDGPASGPAEVVIASGGTNATIVLDYNGSTQSGAIEPVSITLTDISQARAGSTLTATTEPEPETPSIVETVFLSDLETLAEVGIYRGLIRDKNYEGNPISLEGAVYDKGLTITPTVGGDPTYVDFAVTPGADVFRATLGTDDYRSLSASSFQIFIDGEPVHRQFLFTNASRTYDVEFDVSGASVIRLQTEVGRSNGPTPTFADARFETFGPPEDLPEGTLLLEDFAVGTTGWTAQNAGGLIDSHGALVGGGGNAGGSGEGTLSRQISTETGETYTLELDYTFRSVAAVRSDVGTLQVLINDTVVETFPSGAKVDDAKIVFTATRAMTDVTFRYVDNPNASSYGAVSIDDVSVVRTPLAVLIDDELTKGASGWTLENAGSLFDKSGILIGGAGSASRDGTISQEVTTVPGETYTATFDYTFRSGAAVNPGYGQLEVVVDGVVIASYDSGRAETDVVVAFAASETTTTIEFRYVDNPDPNISGAVSVGYVKLQSVNPQPLPAEDTDAKPEGPAYEVEYNFHGYVLDEDFTWLSGHYATGDQKLRIDSQGQTIRFIDDDSILDDDVNRTDRPTDLTQWVEIDGQRYAAYVEKVTTYTDGVETYQFAAIDVDLNQNGRWGSEEGESFSVIAQISGPRVHMGQELDIVSFVQPDLLYGDGAGGPLSIMTYLSDMAVEDAGATHRNLGVMRDIDYFGDHIDLGGDAYDKGVMVVPRGYTPTYVTYDINGADTFKATIGLEDFVTARGEVAFSVEVDGVEVYNSGRFSHTDDPMDIEIDVSGGTQLTLVVDPLGSNNADHPVWADARLEHAPDPQLIEPGLTLHLSDLDAAGQGGIHRGLKLDQAYIDGGIDLGGVSYAKGLSTHAGNATAFVEYDINGADHFKTMIGIEDWVSSTGSVAFSVLVDGEIVFESGVMIHSDDPLELDIDVSGGSVLRLEVDALGAKYADHAVWADARLEYNVETLAGPRPGVVTFNGSQYELGSAGLTLAEAQAEAASKGGTIVDIGSAAEDQFVFQTFSNGTDPIWLSETLAAEAAGDSGEKTYQTMDANDGRRLQVDETDMAVLLIEYDII